MDLAMKQQEQQRLGNYWITRFLGRGGSADVYLGEHISLRRLAAIKVLNRRPTREKLERFWTEASITAELPHPHIVHIFDYDEESAPPFLVMQYARYRSLEAYHRGERLPLDAIVSYVNQIAEALDYVHRRGIIHCDVKPSNILLDADDTVLVSDFGVAVSTDRYAPIPRWRQQRSEEHTSELQSQSNIVCRLLLETKKASAITVMGTITSVCMSV